MAKLVSFDATPLVVVEDGDGDEGEETLQHAPDSKSVPAAADAADGNAPAKDPRKQPKKASMNADNGSATATTNTRKRYSARVGRDVSAAAAAAAANLFNAPLPKSRRDEAPEALEINEENYIKLITMRENTVFLKACRQCQALLFADKAKFRFKEGRVCVEINFCENCADGNIVASDAGETCETEIYEAELFKLVKVHHGIILIHLCNDCVPLPRVFMKDGGLRAEISFCRACCRYNMGLSDALSKYFPYKSDVAALSSISGGVSGHRSYMRSNLAIL